MRQKVQRPVSADWVQDKLGLGRPGALESLPGFAGMAVSPGGACLIQ